ncbi:hypothetical protein BJV78DRAFT_716047 [Lactifluus subvellereus]|nr:hypothetical protein BJV78DRAFT_716047 [Lactifluus subvellereus]
MYRILMSTSVPPSCRSAFQFWPPTLPASSCPAPWPTMPSRHSADPTTRAGLPLPLPQGIHHHRAPAAAGTATIVSYPYAAAQRTRKIRQLLVQHVEERESLPRQRPRAGRELCSSLTKSAVICASTRLSAACPAAGTPTNGASGGGHINCDTRRATSGTVQGLGRLCACAAAWRSRIAPRCGSGRAAAVA